MVGCNTRGIVARKKSEPIKLYRTTMIVGIAGILLCFILGCGDPEPQPSPPPSPDSQPAVDSSAQFPPPTANDPAMIAGAAATNPASKPKPTHTASGAGDTSNEPKPTEAKTAKKPSSSKPKANPNETIASLLRDSKTLEEIKAVLKDKLPPRPEDVTEWKMGDILTATLENDPKLTLAIVPFTQKHAGDPKVAVVLTELLKTQTLPEKPPQSPQTRPPSNDPLGMPDIGMTGMPGAYGDRKNQTAGQIDQQTAEIIAYALAINNTPSAASTLRQIIEDKTFKIIYPQALTKAALQGLAIMEADRNKNDKVLFTALTDPEQYRDPPQTSKKSGYGGDPMMMGGYGRAQDPEQRMLSEQLRTEAENVLKPIASESLRQMLAGHLVKSTTPPEEIQRFSHWLAEPSPMNVPGQLIIYQKKANGTPDPSLDSFLGTLEESFTKYSGAGIARLLGVMKSTPDDLSLLGEEEKRSIPKQKSTGWGTNPSSGGGYDLGMPGPSAGYSSPGRSQYNAEEILAQIIDEKAQKISPEAKLLKLTQQIWNGKIAATVTKRLGKRKGASSTPKNYGDPLMLGGGMSSAANADQDVLFACTMPVDTVRQAMLQRCKNRYQDGPDSALGDVLGQKSSSTAGMDPAVLLASKSMGRTNKNSLLAIDPGLLVVLKTLPREDPNEQSTGSRSRRNTTTPTHGSGSNIQHEWFNTSQQMVNKILTQCLLAAEDTTEAGNSESEEDPCPIAPHRGAKIVKRLDIKLPEQAKELFGNLPVDPLEVHYVRIEETSNLQKILGHYKRVVKGQNHLLDNNMGYWFDTFTEGTTPDRKRSIDVIVSPGIPEPVDPLADKKRSRRKSGIPIVVQILTIEIKDPMTEK